MVLSALIGFHDIHYNSGIKRLFRIIGYNPIDVVYSLDDMIRAVEKNRYDVYLMDTNLDFPNKDIITPAISVLEKLETLYQNSDYLFMSYTGNDECYKNAKNNNIPVQMKGKMDLNFYTNYLNNKKVVNY